MNPDFSALLNSLKTFTVEKVFYALLLLCLCLCLTHIVAKLAGRLLTNPKLDQRVRQYTLAALKVLLYGITALITADALGVPITSLVALLSVLGLAVSLAVQDILGNVAGGLVILFSKPFQIGDYIETDACAGTVVSIDLIHTKLDTYGGQRVMMPNSALSSSKITNYTQLGTRRVEHTISASYGDAIPDVCAACLAAVEMTEHILPEPAPQVLVTAYGESAIQYQVRCWSDVEHYWDAYSSLLENIKASFDSRGVTMTYNHLNIHLVENATEAKL